MKTNSLSHWAVISLIVITCVSFCPISRADDVGEKFKHGEDWEGKILRGFVNTVSGVVEIPGCVCDMNRKHGALKGYTLGFFKGIAMIPVRTAVGVYEVLTFYVPMPPNYEPVLTPPTAFNYWDED